MMALAGVELKTLVSKPDALTIRPTPCIVAAKFQVYKQAKREERICNQ